MHCRTIFLVILVHLTALIGCGGDSSTGPAGDSVLRADLPGGARMDLVLIQPGTFRMGSSDSTLTRMKGNGGEYYSDEAPQHPVTITKGFYLGKYEVTQGQWESVMGTRPWAGLDFIREGPDYPAAYVSWYDAQALIRRLNEAARDSLYRLPTEAEWEYACRAGATTTWSFGDDENQLQNYAWYWKGDTGTYYPLKVGGRRPNPWGLHDMYGNVREWTQDWYGPYSSDSQMDPQGPASGPGRVIRGGYWRDEARYVRSAFRLKQAPEVGVALIGLRLLRRQPPP